MKAPRQKEWIKDLPDGFQVYFRLVTFFGRVVGFSASLSHGGECITRYDTAHGFAHRDVLGRQNALIRKESYETLSLKEVFLHANRDLSENYASYYEFYIAH